MAPGPTPAERPLGSCHVGLLHRVMAAGSSKE